MAPPPHAPRNEPTWWQKNAMPVRVDRNLMPKISHHQAVEQRDDAEPGEPHQRREDSVEVGVTGSMK